MIYNNNFRLWRIRMRRRDREVTEHSEIIDCDYYTAKHRPLPVNPIV